MTLNNYRKEILMDIRSKKLNFISDGRVYYVYRITDIYARKYYYGYRIQKYNDILTDLKSYGSSSKIKKDIINFPEKYKFKIIKKYNNSADAIIHESFLHCYFDAKTHNKFINESNQTPFGFTRAGIEHSQSTKKKLSKLNAGSNNNNYGKKATLETLNKKNEAWQRKIILDNGSESTIAKEATKKYIASLDTIKDGDDITVREKISKHVSEAWKQKVIYNGQKMTLKEKQSIVMAQKRNQVIFDSDGNKTTSFKEGAKKGAQTKIKNGKFYNIYHIDGRLVYHALPSIEVRKISQGLIKATYDKYLGSTNSSLAALRRTDKEKLFGMYVVEIN